MAEIDRHAHRASASSPAGSGTPEGPRRRPTILDVARCAGTSHATVSRYLNGSSYVSQATGAAIEEAITRVGYAPNRSARSLVRRQTQAVAFIVRENPDLFFSDPNLARMAVAANATLAAEDYQMLLLIVDSESSADRILSLTKGGFVDGAILVAMDDHDPVVLGLVGATTPIVTASTPLPDSRIPWVDTDNREGAAAITQALLATGKNRIAEIHGPLSAPVSAQRHAGVSEALGSLYEQRRIAVASEWSLSAGARAMEELIVLDPDLDGVVAASDLLATGAIEVLTEQGRRVPDDVGVVGFDDSPWALQTHPPLSTVHQDADRTGRHLARLLLRMIRGDDLAGYGEVIASRIVWRESA